MVEEKTALLQELESEEDLYIKYKKLARHLEMLDIQESYIKDEQANLKRELIRAQEEVKRIQSVPLVIGQFLEPIDQHTGIVGSTTGSNYVVRILSTLVKEGKFDHIGLSECRGETLRRGHAVSHAGIEIRDDC